MRDRVNEMMNIEKVEISLKVNGANVVRQVEPRLSLVDFIRDALGLTGTHVGCEHGVCGACSVILDGLPVRSCCMFAVQADQSDLRTVEGLAPDRNRLSILQDSFCETHALQCGFCTPGMLIAATTLLAEVTSPSEEQIREAISGNLCRCTGYQPIVDAVKLAVSRTATNGESQSVSEAVRHV
jgi:aerobic carbon-monoxide dehydrogenase small subunit